MKPTKNSVALVIKNERGELLAVRRPLDEAGPLAGAWGLPAITLAHDESESEAAIRVGHTKLGVAVTVGAKIGERTADRGEYILHLSDYEATIANGAPKVPQADASVTQYMDFKYTDDPTILFAAAQNGSLCTQIYLSSLGMDWNRS